MQFLMYEMPYLGSGMAIALDAVTHVFISHGLAIGAFFIVLLSEYIGYRRSDGLWDEFARRWLKVVVIVTTSLGALTGVGIWFFTSVLVPRGISSLLRIFFWPWFIEWMVFTAEVIVILLYYFTWESWSGGRKRRHVLLGAGYLALAMTSGFLITGILGFMLTPDGWPWSGSFWDAFFNPTFWPQLCLRLSGAFALGAIISAVYLLFAPFGREFRIAAVKVIGKVWLLAMAVTALSAWWYFAVVPPAFKAYAVFAVFTSALSQYSGVFWPVNIAAAVFLLALSLIALRGRTGAVKALIIPALVVAFLFVAEFERIREFARGPYVIPGYMYANQVLLGEREFFREKGVLPNSYWFNAMNPNATPAAEGRYLFGQNCSVCHTIGGGVNDIGKRVAGRTADGVYVIIGHTQEMVPYMSPFSGSERERRVLANYLYGVANGKVPALPAGRFPAGGETR